MKPQSSLLLGGLALASACNDLTVNGDVWYDDGGIKYDCGWYAEKTKNCGTSGHKYENFGMTGNQACCVCGGGDAPAGGGDCDVDYDWVHPKYGDVCTDYMPGGISAKWACDDGPKESCCQCDDTPAGSDKANNCVDLTLEDGSMWYDGYTDASTKYSCAYYAAKPSRCDGGDDYPREGMVANDVCCACDGGEEGPEAAECSDLPLPDGSVFHDNGGSKYNCAYYAAKPLSRCGFKAVQYEEQGMTANDACCTCGGGLTVGDVVKGFPKPDEGDNINSEWLGNTQFDHKKHMEGDFILYWNVDKVAETVTFGLLGPDDWGYDNFWIALGVSANGAMVGSDAVLAYFNDAGQPEIMDIYLKSASPTGIRADNRQDISNTEAVQWNGRLGLIFTRPWLPSSDGVELQPTKDYATLIYSKGKVSPKCPTIGSDKNVCNHVQTDRFIADIALTNPGGAGFTLYELNRSEKNQPCQGPAKLECNVGWSCWHEFSVNGDPFAVDYENYGTCQDKDTIGDESVEDEDWTGVQNVYTNDGGHENKTDLGGGFVLLWTVNKADPAGALNLREDTVSVAMISTYPSRNKGWIGFGFSPNGFMMGSDVVVGWEDGDNTHIGDYYLEKQVSSINYIANKQDIVPGSMRVIRKNGQLAIQFTRPLTPADSVQLIQGIDAHVIYAFGPTPDEDEPEFIPYHRYRQYGDVEIIHDPSSDTGNMVKEEMGICSEYTECAPPMECYMLPDQFFEFDWDSMRDEMTAAEEDGTITANSDFGHGGRDPFSNITALQGKGFCLEQSSLAQVETLDWDAVMAGETLSIDPDEYPNMRTLRFGMDLHWKYFDNNERIKIALVGRAGPGWLGLGFGTVGAMLGATAVCGWDDMSQEDNNAAEEYYLRNKLPWEIRPLSEDFDFADKSMEAENIEISIGGIETAIVFERPTHPSTGFTPIIPGEEQTVIFAVGNMPIPEDDFFGYHRFRDSAQVDFVANDGGGGGGAR